MRVNAATGLASQFHGTFPRDLPGNVEKISAASALTRDPGDAGPFRHEQSPHYLHRPTYQNETNTAAPLRDAPFFTSAFVAQLLGQVLTRGAISSADRVAAARAYARVRAPHLRLLNRWD